MTYLRLTALKLAVIFYRLSRNFNHNCVPEINNADQSSNHVNDLFFGIRQKQELCAVRDRCTDLVDHHSDSIKVQPRAASGVVPHRLLSLANRQTECKTERRECK